MSVDILPPVSRLLWGAGTEIQSDLRFRSNQLAKTQKLIRSELVVLRNPPCGIQHAYALVAGPNAISPVVRRGEISAETYYWRLQFPRHLDHFRIHAINVVAPKQRDLIDQHSSLVACGDDEVGWFERC